MIVAFDFDGTLSSADVTTLLAEEKGVARSVSGIVNRAVNGDVPFDESIRERASLLEGLPEREAERAYDRCQLRRGAADLVGDLRAADHHVAVVTGTFERGVRAALDEAGVEVDSLVANRLPYENGAVAGEVEGPLLDRSKADVLEELAVERGVSMGETMAVGDGAHDLPMLQAAGQSVGFRPSPVVRDQADTVLASVEKLHLRLEEHGVV